MPSPLLVTFLAGNSGPWRVTALKTLIGEKMQPVERLVVFENRNPPPAPPGGWALRGLTSNTRYTHRDELNALAARQESLAGRAPRAPRSSPSVRRRRGGPSPRMSGGRSSRRNHAISVLVWSISRRSLAGCITAASWESRSIS